LGHLTTATAPASAASPTTATAATPATTAAAGIGIRHCQRERGTGGDQA
jgi:hypothetical protein